MMMKLLRYTLPFILIASLPSAQTTSDYAELVNSLSQASEFLTGLFYLTGVAFIFTGVNKLKKLGHRTAFMNVDSGVTGPLIMLTLGATLIYFPTFLEVTNTTFWGSPDIAAVDQLQYKADKGSDLETALKPMIYMIQFIGMVAILRGFLILTKSTGQGAQPGTVSKGFVHIIGGVMAVNIVNTVNVIVNTFGTGGST